MPQNNNVNKLLKFLFKEQTFQEKGYLCKEIFFKKITNAIKNRADLIDSQNKYEDVIDDEIQKLREEVDLTLSQIARHLYEINFLFYKKKL